MVVLHGVELPEEAVQLAAHPVRRRHVLLEQEPPGEAEEVLALAGAAEAEVGLRRLMVVEG